MKARHWIVIIIGAVSGTCFAVLAARSLSAAWITPHFSRPWSLAYAAITAVLAYLSFRAATSGRAGEEDLAHALWAGFAGMAVGFAIVCAGYLMVRDTIRIYVTRPLGLHLSQVTMGRLILVSLLLGFAAGFSLRMQKHKEDAGDMDPDK